MRGGKIDIRVFEDRDATAVTDLWLQIFGAGSAWNQASDVIAFKRRVQPQLFFVAVDGDAIIGSVIAGSDGVRGWVHRLAVHPDYQRRGLGGRLMHVAEAGLKTLGCPKLNLQVRADNAEVVAFYEALGYAVEDRISLGKPLTP